MKRWIVILIVVGVLIAGYFGVQAYSKSQAQKSIEDLQTEVIAKGCLLYTSPSPRDVEESRMPSSA